jgi:hypothetical protein
MPTTSHRGKPGSGGGHTTIHDMLEIRFAGQRRSRIENESPTPIVMSSMAERTTYPALGGVAVAYPSLGIVGGLRLRLCRCHAPQRYGLPAARRRAVLYRVIAEHLDAFLETAGRHADGTALPGFVEQEFRDFLTCGVLAHGFARLRCTDCALERLVPFSCKGRGFCPSCGGRRMTECAARLVGELLPRVPVRQWVLSLPYRLRYLLAWDHGSARAVLGVAVRVLLSFQRHHAPIRHSRRAVGMRDRHPAVRRGTEPEHSFPHAALRRRLLRGRRGGHARFSALAAPPPGYSYSKNARRDQRIPSFSASC